MSPAWIAVALTAAGIAALAFGAPRATAAEPERRTWAIERCVADQCDLLPARYSGPTACALDVASERIGRQMPSGVRLSCVKETKR